MARARDADDDPDEEATSPPAARPHRPSRGKDRAGRRPAVQRWSDEDPDDDADEASAATGGARRKEPVYFRARDSAFFEPLVALMIIVLLLVGLYAYTGNWPPMYVVESESMQHGTNDIVGLINTGDLVLAQKLSVDQITPYVVGEQSGYSTYGEYGDVILYHPNDDLGVSPIIHRAIVYIVMNSDGTASFPSLYGRPCGTTAGAVYSVSSTLTGCGTDHVTGTLTLYNIGWQHVTVGIPLRGVGSVSGFVTMGDNNFGGFNGSTGDPDQPGLSDLVQSGWILGAARGNLPWFGSVKLLLDGNADEVPSQSWEWLGLTVVALVVLAIGVHFLLRLGGVEDPRRKADETAAREARAADSDDESDEDDDDDRPRFSWRHPFRRRDSGPAASAPRVARPHDSAATGGRPAPKVGRRSRRTSDDDDEAL